MGLVDRVGRRLGQAMLGAMFIKLGADAAREPGPRVDSAAAAGIPEAETAVRVNGVAMVAGGAALVLDKLPRAAALGLVASLVPTTAVGHPYWRQDGPQAAANEIQMAKNVGLLGGLLVVASQRR